MFYDLECIELADYKYIYNEVDSKIYKIDYELWNKIIENAESSIDIKRRLKQYLIHKGIICNDVIHDRIIDCSGLININEIVLNSSDIKNTEMADKLCEKYHMSNCKRTIKDESSIDDGKNKSQDYTFEDIIHILFFSKKCTYTDEMIEQLNNSWTKIKKTLLDYDTVTIEENLSMNLLFDIIENKEKRLFPCEWGIDKIYIENSYFYRCNQKYKRKLLMNELNSMLSVDEYEPCKLCCVRYICSGVCDREIIKNGKICKLLCEVFRALLRIYILKRPNSIIQLT